MAVHNVKIGKKCQRKIVNIFLSINFNICFGCSKEQSPGSSDGTLDPWVEGHKVRTHLEKSLNLTLLLENSWNLKKVPFVLEFCKIIPENMNWSLKNIKYK